MNSNSALANLTATYTDSENEEGISDEEQSPRTESSQDSQVQVINKQKSSYTPIKKSPTVASTSSSKANSNSNALRLVNYHDDTVVSDDEAANPETISMDISEDEDELKQMKLDEPDPLNDKYAHYGFSLPPIPKGKPQPELVEKIKNLYEKMETNNMDMNKIIQERKEFRNPSIYEKLIQFCDINEFGTNYPPEIYDPLQWGPESYYEELAKVQEADMLKRRKERKKTDKAELAAAAAKKAEEEAKKRKSKWDQPAPIPNTTIKTNIPPPTFTSTITGTKGTVISAFGSLPKKLANM